MFAKEAPKQEVMTVSLVNQNFTLPAGAPNTQVDAQMTFNQGATVWSILPHTHVRGREWKVEVTYPDGRNEVVLAVPKYDFNWQTEYVFKEPLKLPKGTMLRTSAWYDNSPAQQVQPGSEGRRALGRSDLGRDAVHGDDDHAHSAAQTPTAAQP